MKNRTVKKIFVSVLLALFLALTACGKIEQQSSESARQEETEEEEEPGDDVIEIDEDQGTGGF